MAHVKDSVELANAIFDEIIKLAKEEYGEEVLHNNILLSDLFSEAQESLNSSVVFPHNNRNN